MSNDNKRNLRYFESTSMRELYNDMENWQNDNNKRLLSTNIQKDGDMFCCIALTNPSEVVIADSKYPNLEGGLARVDDGKLMASLS